MGVCVEEYAYYVNKRRQNVVWKHECHNHKQRPPNTTDHHMLLNETSHENFPRTPLIAISLVFVSFI